MNAATLARLANDPIYPLAATFPLAALVPTNELPDRGMTITYIDADTAKKDDHTCYEEV